MEREMKSKNALKKKQGVETIQKLFFKIASKFQIHKNLFKIIVVSKPCKSDFSPSSIL